MSITDVARLAVTGAIGGIAGAWMMSRPTRLRQADDRATVLILDPAARRLVHRQVSMRELQTLVPVVRYSYGALAGIAYALLARREGSVVAGAAWGLGLWLLSDAIVLRLITASDAMSWSTEVMSLTGHLLYGATTGMVQRALQQHS